MRCHIIKEKEKKEMERLRDERFVFLNLSLLEKETERER
jgi:hypothetical protein